MIGENIPQTLITPQEISVLRKYITLDELQKAAEVVRALQLRPSGDPTSDYYCMLSAIYAVGRIQGIREERARRKKKDRTSLAARQGRSCDL